MSWWMWTIIIVCTPFLLYIIFRIMSSAVFRSWFEMKKEHENKKKEVL